MARQRKGQRAASDTVRPEKPPPSTKEGIQQPLIKISEEEQWRLINETGILKKIPRTQRNTSTPENDENTRDTGVGEDISDTIFYLVPFSFLLMMMEIVIHYQYNEKPTIPIILDRMIPGVPILTLFIYYTIRYKAYRITQIFLFAISILSGCRLIFQINNANWLTNIKQCPPLATIWIFTIFMADLGPAVLALLTVASFVWWKELHIIM